MCRSHTVIDVQKVITGLFFLVLVLVVVFFSGVLLHYLSEIFVCVSMVMSLSSEMLDAESSSPWKSRESRRLVTG